MKKILLGALSALCVSCALGAVCTTQVVYGLNDARHLTYTADDIGTEKVYETDISVNGTEGFTLEYDIVSFGLPTGATVGEKRVANSDYIIFELLNTEDTGVKVKVMPMHGDDTYQYNRMQADLYSVVDGVETYQETIETYVKILEENHTVAAVEYMGYTYVMMDGVSFIPSSAVEDLGEVSLTVKLKSSAQAQIDLLGTGAAEAPAYGEWSGLGQTMITPLADGVVEFNADDKRADQYNGAKTLVLRENVVNLRGYDVTKPIVLEYSYDITKTMGVWYGVCLGRTAFGDLTKMEYIEDGTLRKDITSNNMIASDGVMFQMGTSKVQSQVQNGLLSDYVSNQGTAGYIGSENLDKLIIEIGESSTKLTFNGRVIFEALTTKRSDFKDGKCYPYFHFIGSPANPYKENKVIIKGVNTPSVTGDIVRVQKGGVAASFTVENYDNANGAPVLYYDAAKTLPVPTDKYVYNVAGKTLTVMNAAFAEFDLGENLLYVANNGGVAELPFLLTDPSIVTEEPYAVSQDIVFQKGQDLIFEVDTSTAEFTRFYGNGIAKADYFYFEENGKQYIKIYKSFLDKFADGEYTFTLVTTDANADTFEGKITVYIGKKASVGCGGTVTINLLNIAMCACGIIFIKRRMKVNG